MNPSNPGESGAEPHTLATELQPAHDAGEQATVPSTTMGAPSGLLNMSNDERTTSPRSFEPTAQPTSTDVATAERDSMLRSPMQPASSHIATAERDAIPRSPTIAKSPEVAESLFNRVYPEAQHPLRNPQILRDNIEKAINMSYLTLGDNYDPEYDETNHCESAAYNSFPVSSNRFPIP